jgi:hypothetical protein
VIGWRKLRDEELCNLYFPEYSWNDQVKEDETDRACSTNGDKRNAYRFWWESQKEETTRKT